jgi:ubiquinone/menaquinone biosynthesis C-methylase UbiE
LGNDPEHRLVSFAGVTYCLEWNVKNPAYRNEWVARQLHELSSVGGTLLDVGAGTGPYRALAEGLGFRYSAHDFADYVPSDTAAGLQNAAWQYTSLDLSCDILDIPEGAKYSVVLCSEVLEHVPDPTAALGKLARLVEAGGSLLVTVPFLSLMHQAPHWHASGLSPFFFYHWIPKFGLRADEITVHGDYVDLMTQEFNRTIRASAGWLPSTILRGLVRSVLRLARSRISEDALTAGGFGVTVRASSPAW